MSNQVLLTTLRQRSFYTPPDGQVPAKREEARSPVLRSYCEKREKRSRQVSDELQLDLAGLDVACIGE